MAILKEDVFALRVSELLKRLLECSDARIFGLGNAHYNSDARNFRRLLRLGSMGKKEKDSRDEPKELWIHGRAYLSAMDMPQTKRNENQYFWQHRTLAIVANRLGGVSDLSRHP
jgi:hypothetical protein